MCVVRRPGQSSDSNSLLWPQQICTQLKSVQPRLQKWISEAETDAETSHLDRLLLINDTINQVISRYAAYVKGDFSVTVSIDPSIDPSKGGADAVPTPKVTDLISFDDDTGAAEGQGTESGSRSLMDDVASLNDPAPAANNAISLPTGHNGAAGMRGLLDLSKTSQPPAQASGAFGDLQGLSGLQWNGAGAASIRPAAAAAPLPGSLAALGSSSTAPPAYGGSSSMQQPMQPSNQKAPTTQPAQQQNKPADPFADLDSMFG